MIDLCFIFKLSYILIILIICILRAFNNEKYRTGSEMTIFKEFTNNCGISSFAMVPIIP
jgi:hypothetical protein